MKAINFPANADSLSVKVTMTGILNITGRIEYDDTDQATAIWGPTTFQGVKEFSLEKIAGENAMPQNGRSVYLTVNMRNYTDSATPANIKVEFFQVQNGVKVLLAIDVLFSGDVGPKSEQRPEPSEIYMLTLNPAIA